MNEEIERNKICLELTEMRVNWQASLEVVRENHKLDELTLNQISMHPNFIYELDPIDRAIFENRIISINNTGKNYRKTYRNHYAKYVEQTIEETIRRTNREIKINYREDDFPQNPKQISEIVISLKEAASQLVSN